MSTKTAEPTLENLQVYEPDHTETAVREQFTHQTGQALETLGKVFKFVPPFNEHIDKNTGQLLISIGKKLKGMK